MWIISNRIMSNGGCIKLGDINVDYIKQDPVKWRFYQIGSYTMWIISNRILSNGGCIKLGHIKCGLYQTGSCKMEVVSNWVI